MSASWQISKGYHRQLGKSITVWAITIHSKLSGNLTNGAYYQTWFQFPRADAPGLYESFTCNMQYKNGSSNVIDIKNFSGNDSLAYYNGERSYYSTYNT